MRAYDYLVAAARWAENAPILAGCSPATIASYASTAPVLYALAARVKAGDMDLSDMEEPDTVWSAVLVYLYKKGIDVLALSETDDTLQGNATQ